MPGGASWEHYTVLTPGAKRDIEDRGSGNGGSVVWEEERGSGHPGNGGAGFAAALRVLYRGMGIGRGRRGAETRWIGPRVEVVVPAPLRDTVLAANPVLLSSGDGDGRLPTARP